MVSNDTMSAVSKFNKCETYHKKITISLTNKKHVLVGSYFYTHISHLLSFDTIVSFDTKYFFMYDTVTATSIKSLVSYIKILSSIELMVVHC